MKLTESHTKSAASWEERFDKDDYISGGFKHLKIMLRNRSGIEKGVGAHITAIKDFIRTVEKETEERVRRETIAYIATKEGWEETEDIYLKHFGLSPHSVPKE